MTNIWKTSQGKNARLEKVYWCGAEWNPTAIDLWAINRHWIIISITEWISIYGLRQDSAVRKHNPTATNLWVIVRHRIIIIIIGITSNYCFRQNSAVRKHNPTATNLWVIEKVENWIYAETKLTLHLSIVLGSDLISEWIRLAFQWTATWPQELG